MRFLEITLTAVCLSLAIGCSQNRANPLENQKDQVMSDSDVITLPADARFAQSVKSMEVICLLSSACNPSVGMLSAYHLNEGIAACTAFLVGDDIAMTNRHCIPDDLLEEGTSCRGRMWIHFSKLASSLENVDCDKVLFTSPKSKQNSALNSANPDYAFLKLSRPTQRPFLKLSREGLSEEKSYTVFSSSPLKSDKTYGVIKDQKCSVKFNTFGMESKYGPHSDTVLFGDCVSVIGNSGSPVLNEKNEVVAITQASWNNEKVRSTLHSLGFILRDIANLSGGTNLSCVPIPHNIGGSIEPVNDDACKTVVISKDEENILREAALFFNSPEANLIKGIRWKAAQIKPIDNQLNKISFIAVPDCIEDNDIILSWKDRFLSSDDRMIEIKMPVYDVSFEFNRYLQAKPLAHKHTSEIFVNLLYSPESLKKTKSTRAIITGNILFENQTKRLEGSLGMCSP